MYVIVVMKRQHPPAGTELLSTFRRDRVISSPQVVKGGNAKCLAFHSHPITPFRECIVALKYLPGKLKTQESLMFVISPIWQAEKVFIIYRPQHSQALNRQQENLNQGILLHSHQHAKHMTNPPPFS